MDKMVFSGRMDGACGEAEFFRVVAEPVRHTHGVFTALWREVGGRFDGDVREGRVPEDARLLHRMARRCSAISSVPSTNTATT